VIKCDEVAQLMKVNLSAVLKHIEKLKKKKVLRHKSSTNRLLGNRKIIYTVVKLW